MENYFDDRLGVNVKVCEFKDLGIISEDIPASVVQFSAREFPERQQTFQGMVGSRMKADNRDVSETTKKADAVRFCVGKYPDLHEKFFEANKQRRSERQEPPGEAEGQDDKPVTFDEAVEARIKADSRDVSDVKKKAEAVRFCIGKYPELHKKFLAENRQK